MRRLTTVLIATALAVAAPVRADLDALVVPRGEFVSLDTHRLYYRCVGEGGPTVVIDAGIGGSALEWTPVQDALAEVTRVCTYDRAGYGWSDPGPSPRTTAQAVSELRALLARAGERPPWVLVGHSFGGFNMRYLAARHRGEVGALVLVDSSHPDELPESASGPHLARHAIVESRFVDSPATLAPYAQAAGFLNSRRKALFAQMDELGNFDVSARQVADSGALGEVPLVVIARDGDVENPRERHWRELQGSLATLSARGRLVVAADSGHDVHLSRPDVVVATIVELVAALRRGPEASRAP